MKKILKIILKIILILLAILFILICLIVLLSPKEQIMYYTEDSNTSEYQINNVVFGSHMSDYRDIAFEPNVDGFRGGVFWIDATMYAPAEVTVNSYTIYGVYKDETTELLKSDLNQRMAFQKTEYDDKTVYSSSAANVDEIFCIPDSRLKEIKGVRVIANVTVNNDGESVTEDMEFFYETKCRAIPVFLLW
jgi:hypothetical protein